MGRDYTDESTLNYIHDNNPVYIDRKQNEKHKKTEKLTMNKLKQVGLL